MLISEIKRQEYYENILITSIEDLMSNISKIESLFRNSKEYKKYIGSIREGLQIKNCAFFETKDFSDVDLELHHIFPRLYDIVIMVGTDMILRLDEGEFLTVYQIVDEVIKFHMRDYPIVMMLSTTLHQLHHSGQYTLPNNSKSLHLGEYKEFVKKYKKYIQKEDLEKIQYFLSDIQSKELEEIYDKKD